MLKILLQVLFMNGDELLVLPFSFLYSSFFHTKRFSFNSLFSLTKVNVFFIPPSYYVTHPTTPHHPKGNLNLSYLAILSTQNYNAFNPSYSGPLTTHPPPPSPKKKTQIMLVLLLVLLLYS